MTSSNQPKDPLRDEIKGSGAQALIPLGVSIFVFFIGMSQISQTAWFFLPIFVLVVGTFLGMAVTPTAFLFSIPVALLLNRTGIGPEEWLDSLLNGGNPFFLRGGRVEDFTDELNVYDLGSMGGWVLLAAGIISCHSFGARYLARRHSPFWTGEPVPESKSPDLCRMDVGFLLGLGLLVVSAMFGWVMTEFLFDKFFEPRIVQMLRWTLVVGGGLVVGLFFRIILGLLESRAMDPTAAAGLLADASWRDLGKPLNSLDRWLMWWRLGRRKKAETRWRRLLRGIKPRQVVVADKKSLSRKGGS